MSTAPVIALSATSDAVHRPARVRLNEAYTRAVEEAGGVPVIIPPLAHPARADCLLERAHALILTGGEDVDPALYGQRRHERLGTVHVHRDATELALVTAARERSTPTLAICRGIQLLNVAMGGTLVQDIAAQRPGSLDHDPGGERSARVHEVTVEPGSELARALGGTRFGVNSVHHQALDRVADSLRVTARSPDGLVEGVEGSDGRWWVLGVQWHPEELIGDGEPWDRALFAAVVERARVSSSASVLRREPVA